MVSNRCQDEECREGLRTDVFVSAAATLGRTCMTVLDQIDHVSVH
jgi:hypothetical protein